MISDNDITSSESLGVTKKLLGQYKAFNNLGCDAYHLCFKDEQGVLIHGDDTTVLVKRQPKMYFTYLKLLKFADKVCLENKIDMCYIRYPLADFAFMKMIKKLHKICKVIIEIPTYPYDDEIGIDAGFITKFNFKQDLKNRYKLKNYTDLIVDIGNEKTIYGIRCANIYNSIDIDSVPFDCNKKKSDIDIHILSVALIRPDHRFDRLICGLREYYNKKTSDEPDVFFDIVGSGIGDEKERLEKLAKETNLEKYVRFHGTKSGKELDELFDSSIVAISTLNSKCAEGEKTSVLKTREYCARGIPFISSMPDIAIPDNSDFCKLFKSCDDPIDVREIISYVDYIKS
ncbi:MAG: glycosyltransferase, partial [Clostridia bacterium]|nr:glycosyltransferase [Clostridia bacterium]